MPYSITTKDGITIQNIPDDVPPDHPSLKERVAKIRGGGQDQQSPVAAEKPSLLDEIKGGLASAPINAYLGIKQLFGGLDPTEQKILKYNKEAADKAPVSSFVSNVATTVPTMLIPGVNTVAGSALMGGGMGLIQPVDGEQSLLNIAEGKTKNTGIGAVTGGISQYLGQKLGGVLSDYAAKKVAEKAAIESRNAVRDATLAEAQGAGYSVPRSLYDPSFLSNRLESLGGKAAIKQQAAVDNQQVTNALARQALGLEDDQPITKSTLEAIRKDAAQPYREIASLSPQAAADLEALKQARNDAQGWFKAYNRSASPADLAKAKEYRAAADSLEQALENHAASADRADLVPALAEARKRIAKTYTVERSLNDATGDVSAPVIGRMFDKGLPLSDGLDTVGRFRSAFPQVSQAGPAIPAAGVSKSEALASMLMGGAGAAVTGNPYGMAAAVLPFASHPARALALSKFMQSAPEYGIGAKAAIANKLDPETAAMLARILAVGSATGLSTQ